MKNLLFLALCVLAGAAATAPAALPAPAASTPIQHLTYTKAVAYWTAQAKAHGMAISCTPWTAQWVSSDYQCVFGSVNRVEILAQPRCVLVLAVYERSHRIHGGGELDGPVGSARVPVCSRGWQAGLPSPWNLPHG